MASAGDTTTQALADTQDDREQDWGIRHRVRATATGYQDSMVGQGEWLDVSAVVVIEVPATPSTPTLVSRTTDSLTVEVAAVAGATGYRWRLSLDGIIASTVQSSVGPEVVFTGLTPDTPYWIDVRAENSAGESDYSLNLVTGTAMSPIPATPSTPTLVSREETTLTLQVAAVSGATSYRWRYSTDATIDDSDPMITSIGNTVLITALDHGAPYWIDVQARNAAGDSAYSGDLETATLTQPAPPIPANVVTTSTDEFQSVTVSWDASLGAEFYRIWGEESQGDGAPYVSQFSAQILATAMPEYFRSIPGTTDWRFRVRAEGPGGNSDQSPWVFVLRSADAFGIFFNSTGIELVSGSATGVVIQTENVPVGDTVSFSIMSGPAWVTVGATTMDISPPSGVVGAFTVTVLGTTSSGETATATLLITVTAAPTVTYSPGPYEVDDTVTATLSSSAGTSDYRWQVFAGGWISVSFDTLSSTLFAVYVDETYAGRQMRFTWLLNGVRHLGPEITVESA